jgi:hypothetical protein
MALVKTGVSEEYAASIIRVRRFSEAGMALLVTSIAILSLRILVKLIMEAVFLPNRRFLQEPHGVTFQKTAFFSYC